MLVCGVKGYRHIQVLVEKLEGRDQLKFLGSDESIILNGSARNVSNLE